MPRAALRETGESYLKNPYRSFGLRPKDALMMEGETVRDGGTAVSGSLAVS